MSCHQPNPSAPRSPRCFGYPWNGSRYRAILFRGKHQHSISRSRRWCKCRRRCLSRYSQSRSESGGENHALIEDSSILVNGLNDQLDIGSDLLYAGGAIKARRPRGKITLQAKFSLELMNVDDIEGRLLVACAMMRVVLNGANRMTKWLNDRSTSSSWSRRYVKVVARKTAASAFPGAIRSIGAS